MTELGDQMGSSMPEKYGIQRHGGVITLVPFGCKMYIHNGSTCVCTYKLISSFMTSECIANLLFFYFYFDTKKDFHYLDFLKVAFLSLALHNFSLNFVALIFCSDCHFTIELQMNPLTASLFLHWYRK